MGVISEAEEPSDELLIAIQEMCGVLKVPEPADTTVLLKDNAVTALLHWKVLVYLLAMLEDYQVRNLREMYDLREEEKAQLPGLPEAFDSHCHLDRTAKVLGLKKEASLHRVCSHLVLPEALQVLE